MGFPSASGSDVSMSMKSPFSTLLAQGFDVVYLEGDIAVLVAALAQDEVARERRPPEARLEVAEELAGLFLTIDVEHDVAGEHGEHVDAFFGTFELTLAAHLVGDVDDGDVEPGDAAIVDDVMATVIDPELREIGTVETVGDSIPVTYLDLLVDFVEDAFAIVGMHHAGKGVARDGAKLVIGLATEHVQDVMAHVVDGSLIVCAVAEQAPWYAVEELLGDFVFYDASVMRTQLALGNAVKYGHVAPIHGVFVSDFAMVLLWEGRIPCQLQPNMTVRHSSSRQKTRTLPREANVRFVCMLCFSSAFHSSASTMENKVKRAARCDRLHAVGARAPTFKSKGGFE